MPPLWPLVFGNVLLRCEAKSSPWRNLHNSAESTLSCVNVSMAWWGKFIYRLQWEWKEHVGTKILSDFILLILNHFSDPGPSMGEIKVPRNMMHKSQHTPQEAAYSEMKNSGGRSRHCKGKAMVQRATSSYCKSSLAWSQVLTNSAPQATEASREPLSRSLAARI